MDRSNDNPIAPDVLADLQSVCEAVAKNTALDPEVASRVEDRGIRAREEILERFGVQEIGAEIIRDSRAER